MGSPNATYTDIVTSTIESRTGIVQDNLTNNNPLLGRLQEKGKIQTISGGSVILQEIIYNDPNTNYAGSYSGYDTINISPDSPISAASFALKMYAEAVTINGQEILENSGSERIFDLLATRVEIAEARLRNKIDLDLHGNASGNNGKNLSGLADMFSAVVPGSQTGVYGGIDRALWAFWRNNYIIGTQSVATGGNNGATTAANIQNIMNNMALSLVRGNDHVDFIYAGITAYATYLASLQAIQRISDDKMAAAGFSSLKFYGGAGSADVVLGGGIGGNQTANYMHFINTNYIHFRPHKDRNFVPIGGDRMAVNQDAVIKLIGWAGALTCSGLQFQGLLAA